MVSATLDVRQNDRNWLASDEDRINVKAYSIGQNTASMDGINLFDTNIPRDQSIAGRKNVAQAVSKR